jgi:hypothetical protein
MAEQLKTIEKAFKPPQDGFSEFIDENYEFNPKETRNIKNPKDVRSIAEMVYCLESNEAIELDARVIAYNPKTNEYGIKKIGRAEFLKSYNVEIPMDELNLREAKYIGEIKPIFREAIDAFATDAIDQGTSGGLIGNDFIPILGGPFFKQLYFYDSWIQQANSAFYAYHHDPFCHQAVEIIKDFTLGRGFRVDSRNNAALALWDAFEKANNLQEQFEQLARELSVTGEIMIWKLPDRATKIVQNPYYGQKTPTGLLPRIRLLDASVFVEIVTDPEDITSVQAYVWLAPTQYQIYSGLASNPSTPSEKFIFQTIPADQINHYRVNAFSNEKRGRSDLFSVLGFAKRLRDSVNYSLVALQKQASWCIDTTVEGNQADINSYIQDQQSIGTNAPAGSEFVHSDKIKREYRGVEGTGKGGGNVTFEWALSAFASGIGIPVSYFGTHMSGGQTRASAIVATEPVAKKFEGRQKIYERIIHDLWDYLMDQNGINAECEVFFPEIITADRSQKLQDLAFGENMKWWSTERSAIAAAKEMNFNDFVYEQEMDDVADEGPIPAIPSPLTSLGQMPTPKPTSDIPSVDKAELKKQYV